MLTLRPYQIEGRDFLAARRFALLGDEMRLGKSPQAILAAHKVGAEYILVVCPAIAVPQWEAEFDRWWPGISSPLYEVMSYDRARMTDFSAKRYDVAIIDECQYAKTPEAKRTKAVFGKGGIGWHSSRMWCLSGTPMINHPGELYPMLKAFGVTDLTYWQFCQRYCTYDWTGRVITGTKQSMVPEIKSALARIMLRRTRKQVAPDMPEIDFQFLAIDPVSQVDLASEDEHDPSRKEVAIAKALPLVEEIVGCLERGDYKQTVVFAWHRDAIHAVRAGLDARGIDAEVLVGGMHDTQRTAIQKRFMAGEIQVVVAQIIAAGVAIDLSAASHGHFLELDWVGANNLQAANRLISLMKSEPVTFDVCSLPGSIDERVQRVLIRKMNDIRAVGLA